MSSQSRLVPEAPGVVIPVQPYANLLKACSILLDILPRHPSIRLWDPTKEYFQFQLLANLLKGELKAIEEKGLVKPGLDSLQQADLRIWTDIVNTVNLKPDTQIPGSSTWHNADEETLWQGFGTFLNDPDVKPEDCMIIVFISRHIEKARIVAQNQRGAELVSLRINRQLLDSKGLLSSEPAHEKKSSALPSNFWTDYYHLDYDRPLARELNTVTLAHFKIALPTRQDLGELSCVLRSLIFCQEVTGIPKDHGVLHSLVLLFAVAIGSVSLVRKCLSQLQGLRCLDFYDEHELSILDVARQAATKFSGAHTAPLEVP